MSDDDLDRAREKAERAARALARYPSSANATKARLALRKLQKIARTSLAPGRGPCDPPRVADDATASPPPRADATHSGSGEGTES